MNQPIVWSIAGHDPAGLAGIQVDRETFNNLSVRSCSIITAVTAQNTQTVTAIESISGEQVAAQCQSLYEVFKPVAIKIGMLGNSSTHVKITNFLAHYKGFVVLDPVLMATSGAALYFQTLSQQVESLTQLFPYVDLITPNLFEAEKILNRSITSYQEMVEAAQALLELGAKSVLLKGGHVKDVLFSQDYWTNGRDSFWIANQRSPETNYRGTGCVLSSAIAACMALGYPLKDAIVLAKMYVNRGIRRAFALDPFTAKLFHGEWPEEQDDLPYLSAKPLTCFPPKFKTCPIGLYPVVDGSHWLEKLLPQGVQCIQLRIKNTPPKLLEAEIKRSIVLAKRYHATLFINDYWELAIRLGADGVHLGQEDLHTADMEEISHSGLYLGVSTHCYHEVARAHALNPSYVACGPIYATTSKIMAFQPQGIEQLKRWSRTLHYSLVAIGGISLERLPEVLQAKISGVSLISAITKAPDPLIATQQFLNAINELTTS